MKRQTFLLSGAALLSGCSAIGTKLNDSAGFHRALGAAQWLDERVIGTRGMARLYPADAISPEFPLDSLPTPATAGYARLVADGFSAYRLHVDGLVPRERAFSLADLRAIGLQTQTTRHDCVEGWSAIARWTGVPLRRIVEIAQPRRDARYLVFDCFDVDSDGTPYYESLDLQQAMHPQTLLALEMNGAPITADHGAPVRLRVPTQLGYKSAKWVRRIAFLPSMHALYGGKGGYWEDQGYEWYAGI